MTKKKKFSPLFWLVIMFEFFERGSYYGMMSVLSVYFTDVLKFEKGSVGVIKSIIQPLLYFLPIITGALADRFGYRKVLMVAFSLLGTGYFLTANQTTYGMVFAALVVMGIGAGTFKPVISGSIARLTDEENSAVGFGIYYWSINLGAFLFPLILVPFLKNNIGWKWVFYASAIGTGAMLIPTLLFFKEPPSAEKEEKKQTNLLQTLANSFEIIYSPIVLIHNSFKEKKMIFPIIFITGILYFLTTGITQYISGEVTSLTSNAYPVTNNSQTYYIKLQRNMMVPKNFKIEGNTLTIYKPDLVSLDTLAEKFKYLSKEKIKEGFENAKKPTILKFARQKNQGFKLEKLKNREFLLKIGENTNINAALKVLQNNKFLKPFNIDKVKQFIKKTTNKPFTNLFVGILLLFAILILFLRDKITTGKEFNIGAIILIGIFCFLLPDISIISRIVGFFIFLTVISLFSIDTNDKEKYKDHFKFLLLIFIYSGFWVLYFQMFDSVLWYVQAYVDATPLNNAVNSFFAMLGLNTSWYFDVEHVTVINALTIIALQLFVTSYVKDKEAMTTMIGGLVLGVIGMSILAISTGIWVFLAGIVIFSIGEMTVHPKFISYVGQIAPKDKVAMYMGYLFLYGVIGASIGGVLGAKMYVHYVDRLNQPKTLWILFSLIGVATILAILWYNKTFSLKNSDKKV